MPNFDVNLLLVGAKATKGSMTAKDDPSRQIDFDLTKLVVLDESMPNANVSSVGLTNLVDYRLVDDKGLTSSSLIKSLGSYTFPCLVSARIFVDPKGERRSFCYLSSLKLLHAYDID